MVKLVPNEFIQEIRGTLDKIGETFRVWKGRQVLEKKPVPTYTRTQAQDEQRRKFKEAVRRWHSLTPQEKEEWRKIGAKQHLTGYQAFLSYWIPKIKFFDYKVIIDNTQNSNTLSNYQILLQISGDQEFFNTFLGDHKYLEVYDTDKTTLLNFWIEEWNTTNYRAKIWIKVPTIQAQAKKELYLKCNTERTQSLSNETLVFDYVDRGNQISNWVVRGSAGQTTTIGNPAPSYYAVSTSGSYMYRDIGLDVNRIIVFNVRSNGLGNFFFLVDSTGAGQMYRIDTRSNNYSGFATTNSWTSWNAPTSGFTAQSNTWYKFIIVISSTHATLYYAQTTDSSPVISPGTMLGTYPITKRGSYIGLVGDALGSAYTTWWDNIIVRKFTSPEPTVTYVKL